MTSRHNCYKVVFTGNNLHLSDFYVDLSDLYVDLSDIMSTYQIIFFCMALTGQEHVF